LRYQLLFRPRRASEGHKVFREVETGRIAMADWSGFAPDETDDGPLYVQRGQEIQLELSKYGPVVVVPVKCRDGSDAKTWTNSETAEALRQYAEVRITRGEQLRAITALATRLCGQPEGITS
jgi:hypothetical protein